MAMNSMMTPQPNELNTLLEFGTGPKADIRYECAHHAYEEICLTLKDCSTYNQNHNPNDQKACGQNHSCINLETKLNWLL